MIRMDLGYFLRLSANLSRLRSFRTDAPISEIRPALQEARTWLIALGQEQMFGTSGFRTAKHRIPPLLNRIEALLGRDDESTVDFMESVSFYTDLNNFENALLSEASMADAYYVTEKPPYSTLTLVTRGEALFPPSTLDKVPEAYLDLQEVGKCLAFELPTAGAFHIHRATEAVLRRYWSAVSGGAAKPKLRTIGVYLAAMKQIGCGDSKVIAALTQMNELHRNPTIHPGDHLSLDEAIALLGIANSVVAAMLKEIPNFDPEQLDIPDLTVARAAE